MPASPRELCMEEILRSCSLGPANLAIAKD
jgi:hypothetical protein